MINEQTLLLYYYDDGLTRAERTAIEKALETDRNVAHQYRSLCAELDKLRKPEPQVIPSDMLRRLQDTFDGAVRSEAVKTRRHESKGWRLFGWGTSVVAALVVGIAIGVLYDPRSDLGEIPIVDESSNSFSRGLSVYLRESQMEIASLPANQITDRSHLLQQIIQQNRMFERAAEINRSPDVARLLRAFEPLLLELASEDTSPAEAEVLRCQLDFEMKVMLTKLLQEQSDDEHST